MISNQYLRYYTNIVLYNMSAKSEIKFSKALIISEDVFVPEI